MKGRGQKGLRKEYKGRTRERKENEQYQLFLSKRSIFFLALKKWKQLEGQLWDEGHEANMIIQPVIFKIDKFLLSTWSYTEEIYQSELFDGKVDPTTFYYLFSLQLIISYFCSCVYFFSYKRS